MPDTYTPDLLTNITDTQLDLLEGGSTPNISWDHPDRW